jgi:hypothetical protein
LKVNGNNSRVVWSLKCSSENAFSIDAPEGKITMRHSTLLALTLLLVNSAARSQTSDDGVQPQTTQSADATGVIGPFTERTAPPEFVPMTASERFRVYLLRTFGIGSILDSAAGAGIRQWEDTPKEWKHGAEGYGDRLGSSYATHLIRETLEYGASAALREDNRYIRSGESGFWKRSKHAVVYTFMARNDAGNEHFAYSRFGSAAGAAFISRIWQPHSTNSGGDGAVVFGSTIGSDVGANMFHEFWPDIRRHVLRRSH